ncbi:NADPH-dependent FMN reductase [Planococcus lenghuensis]|uniref:FMN reductase (NADPH) n=1 Tax=Planococcus lenghuensis TaxID=2213202 RepID=A0A1Q2KYA2_9BACL|nr:NADPH-dependent FMN reductase [Planococcus lenghuensis]AQQ53181.1 FMN reductase (NADPH) [Planococcus lenghuensis]
MANIVIVSGSPSESSRSETVLTYLGNLLQKQGLSVKHLSVRDVPQTDLFTAKYDSPAIQEISTLIHKADGVVIGSPVYKAAYSGVLKALLDLLPQDVLQDTPVLPLMTGGSPNHLLALEYSLKPLLATLKGQNLKGVYLVDSQIDKSNPVQPILDSDVQDRLTKQLAYFMNIIGKQKETASFKR